MPTIRPRDAIAVAIVLIALSAGAPFASRQDDLAAARELFERNLDAIRRRDREGYLACYLRSGTLARAGAAGLRLGFDEHASQSGDQSWPDRFEALDLELVPVLPGVVYGTYRYRVAYGASESSGLSERVFVKTREGWRIAVTTAFEAPAGTPAPPRALVGATLLDGTGAAAVSDAVVLLREGRIECAGRRADCPIPESIERLDLTGSWIVPGLVDAHVHFSQTGWADGRPDALDLRDSHPYDEVQASLKAHPERWFGAYLCSGVTSVFDVGGYSWTLGLSSRAENDSQAPHVAAAGPLLSTLDHWLGLPAERQFIHLTDAASAASGAAYLKSHGAAAIKVWFINRQGMDFESMEQAVMAAGREAARLSLPLIVHATGLREAKSALKAGARMLVHSVWDLPVDEEFLELARKGDVIYCPTLTVSEGYRRMYASIHEARPPQVDDPHGCVDQELLDRIVSTPGRGAGKVPQDRLARAIAPDPRRAVMMANLRRIHEAGIPVVMGTDAGNPLTLHGPSVYAEMEAMAEAGLTPMQVLVASTQGGARAMGRQADLGTLQKGKIADLLVVGKDPLASVSALRDIRYVVRAGVVRRIQELRRRPG